MKIQGSCAVCNERFMPFKVKEDVTYYIEAKFISMSEKNIILCEGCYDAIQRKFPEKINER
ncbi:hypothetical protein [Paenibacillus crassostreae]|nr:hypothetical protein [Paenibacillus crassostreae]